MRAIGVPVPAKQYENPAADVLMSIAAQKAGIDLSQWDQNRGADAPKDIILKVYSGPGAQLLGGRSGSRLRSQRRRFGWVLGSDPSVVAENVQPPEVFRRGLHGGVHFAHCGHFHLQRHGAPAERLDLVDQPVSTRASRGPSARFAPDAANASAMVRPRPRAASVTNATWPVAPRLDVVKPPTHYCRECREDEGADRGDSTEPGRDVTPLKSSAHYPTVLMKAPHGRSASGKVGGGLSRSRRGLVLGKL
jgi:hypothetical protein